ncbi:hypothetical protein RND71_007134 [Anisodus tanguticus]|uniref:Glutaredoxin domain-containing protein n=1 Tax=Anisodus tanguticus TaxID=243964 RepID=A0AAE1SL99_9SOLA|nr:hypothetical protein RND71_007134 [Anisodus tanguticus]
MKSMKREILRKINSLPTLVFQVNHPTKHFQSHLTTNTQHDNEMFCQNISSHLANDVDQEKIKNISSCEYEIYHSCTTTTTTTTSTVPLSTPQSLQESDTMEENKTLDDFEYKCPPGGKDAVIFYTTSLRGIRKTFEDCNTIRILLDSFRVVYCERDVSLDIEYRDELWRILGGRIVPPRLFIRGRHIGGADEVVGFHEQGILKKLLHGIPLISSNFPCKGCCGIRFVLCLSCHGSCKIIDLEGKATNGYRIRCAECNENGLFKCPVCS